MKLFKREALRNQCFSLNDLFLSIIGKFSCSKNGKNDKSVTFEFK